MQLNKINLSFLITMSSLVISMSGCGNKSKKNDSQVNNAVTPFESNKSEVETDYSNVIQTESSLEAVGYKFKYDSTTKQFSWDEEFRENYLKSLSEPISISDIIPVLENHETVLLNFVQKYKPSKSTKDVTIRECEAKAQLVRQTIDVLKVEESNNEKKPKDKTDEKQEDKGKSETVKPSDSSSKSKKAVPVPKKKPKL